MSALSMVRCNKCGEITPWPDGARSSRDTSGSGYACKACAFKAGLIPVRGGSVTPPPETSPVPDSPETARREPTEAVAHETAPPSLHDAPGRDEDPEGAQVDLPGPESASAASASVTGDLAGIARDLPVTVGGTSVTSASAPEGPRAAGPGAEPAGESVTRLCVSCGKPLPPTARPHARSCSAACRQRLARSRRTAVA